MYEIELTNTAHKHLDFFRKSGNKPLLRKICNLLEELEEHPYEGTGKPEPLKYDYSGYWSRRITDEHRLIYLVQEDKIKVIISSLKGHY